MAEDIGSEPLAAFPYIRTTDTEEWQHSIKAALSCTKQDISPSTDFSAYINATNLGSIMLAGMGASALFSHQYILDSDDLLINMLLKGEVIETINNDVFHYRPGGISVVHQKDSAIKCSADNVSSLHIALRQHDITRFANTIFGRDQDSSFYFNKVIRSNKISHFHSVVMSTVRSLDAIPDIVNQPLVACQYEQLLMLSFLVSIPQIFESFVSETTPNSTKSVRIVEDYLEQNIDQPVRLEDLVAITGQSVRTIQEAFRKYRGYSPSSYLRMCRLAKARKVLQESPPDTSIVSVALACGFASHGHFSQCYKKRFGETPQSTLRKHLP